MNRLGGKSNTGEGGEDEERYLDTTKGTIFEIIKKKLLFTQKFETSISRIFLKIRNESAIRN